MLTQQTIFLFYTLKVGKYNKMAIFNYMVTHMIKITIPDQHRNEKPQKSETPLKTSIFTRKVRRTEMVF